MPISALPIDCVEVMTGGPPIISRVIEESGQTFVNGTPVQVASDGGIKAWDGTTTTAGICGIATEDSHNIATTGAGWNGGLAPYTGIGAQQTFSYVPNQPNAVNIVRGAVMLDGRVGFYSPTGEFIFRAVFGNNGALATPANTDVGVNYGLTIDSNSKYWYVDKSKTSTNAVLTIVSLDPVDGSILGARVLFKFLPASIVPVVS